MSEERLNQQTDNQFDDVYDEDEDMQANKYLTFHLSSETYGFSIRYIIDIIEMQKISPVPEMPEFVKGVINLRGKVIPVVDMRLRFNMPERDYDDKTCIIVIQNEKETLGFIVDTVEEVVEIQEESIDPPPQFHSTSDKNRFIKGMGKIGEKIKILLDVEKLLLERD